MKKYSLPLGKSKVDFDLESTFVFPKSKKTNLTANSAEDALSKPVGSDRLAKLAEDADKVAIVIPDATRAWQNINRMASALRYSLDKVHSCDWVIGGGQHRLPTDTEVEALTGSAVREDDNIHFHDSSVYTDTGLKTSRGNPVTLHKIVYDADLVILAGGITHHDLAGFSGGRKALIPGVSGRESIIFNHSLCLEGRGINRATGCGLLEGNPAHEDMMEYASLALKDKDVFILNVVPDQYGKPFYHVAGSLVDAWQEGVRAARELQVLTVGEKVDFALVSPGGYPCDMDLYQSTKTISAVQGALKQGAPIIMAAALEDGMGPGDFRWMVERSMKNVDEVLGELQSNFTIPGFIAFKLVMDAGINPLKLVTRAKGVTFPGEVYSCMDDAIKSCDEITEAGAKGLILSAGNCVIVNAEN